MDDQIDRLKAALADRYDLDGELGAGGMATVYLAHDLKHKRKGRFVMVKSNPNIGREIRLVSNWFEELDTNGRR